MKMLPAILIAMLAIGVESSTPEIRYFRYERPIQRTSQSQGQTCFAVDPSIFPHAAPQLADLRVYRDGVESPYVLRLASPSVREAKTISPLNLGLRGKEIVFDAPMPDGKYADVELDVTAQNFIATVVVTGSTSQTGSPETRLGSFTIFDLSGQRLGRSTVLHLPESDFRHLHFRIDGLHQPQNVTGISTERLPPGEPKYLTVAQSASVTRKGRSSIVEFTLPANVPVDRISFVPGAEPASFSRDVSVAVTATPSSPPQEGFEPQAITASTGNLLRVHREQNGHRIDEERLSLDASPTQYETPSTWVISIENGDDAPIQLQTVRLEMLERTLCYQAAAQVSYTLFYGDQTLAAPHYDYSALFSPDSNASAASTGAEQANPQYESRPDQRPLTERHPALLWIALIAVLALLGGIAVRSVKRLPADPR